MLNTSDYLLSCIGEECGEVQQIVGKSLRFGLDSEDPVSHIKNIDSLTTEVHDVIALYFMLCEISQKKCEINYDSIVAKQQRVINYMRFSRELGRLESNGN